MAAPSACIVGVGAVGGWLASLLHEAGWDVRLLARGATLAAVREHGLKVEAAGATRALRLAASDDPGEIGPVDYAILTVKGQDLPALGPRLTPLLSGGGALVTAMNGLQWWFTEGLPGPLEGEVLEAVDPGGVLRGLYPAQRVIGAVVHASATSPEPGRVRLVGADRLTFGEPDGRGSERAERLTEACASSGLNAAVSENIRLEIWRKLWGNMSMNPLGALTRATTGRLLDDPETRALVGAMMGEMARLGDRLGLPLGMTPEERMAVTRKLGDFRTSMQQDAEAGRRLELNGLLTVLVEMADRLGEPAPFLHAVHGLARQLDLSLAAAGR
ncbi:MAG TPA: 2-dehydropantoate 2-reductase [Caulobacteraceae bacterium]